MSRRPRVGERRGDVYCEAVDDIPAGSVVTWVEEPGAVKLAHHGDVVAGVALRKLKRRGRGWVRYYGATKVRTNG